MARILGQLPQQATTTLPTKGGRVLGVAPQSQNQSKSIVLPPKQTIGEQINTFTSQPTFRAVEGGAGTILPNIARVVGNIPSSAARLARDTVSPVNPLDINSPLNIGANIVKSAQTATDIVKNRGVVQGAKDVVAGVADIGKKGFDLYKKAGETIYSGLERNVTEQDSVAKGVGIATANVVSDLAKVGIEDPLFVPSLLYAPTKVRGTGITTDVISDISRPLIDETKKITTAVVESPQFKKTVSAVTPDILTKDVGTMRTEKMVKGLETQNNRLKTVGESFEENTISRKSATPDTPNTVITPADTFVKYKISPEVNKGTIEMGDYKNGSGALGKIREEVSRIDGEITQELKASGVKKNIDEFKNAAISRVSQNDRLKASGKVQSTINDLEKRFEDYKASYGSEVDIEDINKIRKQMNLDFDPMTQDSSRIIGDVTRDFVYNAVPEGKVKTLLLDQAELLSARNYAEKLNGTKVVGGRLGNYVLRTLGATIGSSVTQLPLAGPIIGAVGGEFAARALQQAQFKSLGAETKALFQRSSKMKDTTIKAKTIPNNTIDVSNSTPPKPRVNPQSRLTPNSKGFISFNTPLRGGGDDVGSFIAKNVKAAEEADNFIPGVKSKLPIKGVTIDGKTFKSVDEATKRELKEALEYINTKRSPKDPINERLESLVSDLGVKFNINADTANTKLDGIYRSLLEQTKTTPSVTGRNLLPTNTKVDNLTSSIQKAKKSGQSFDAWVKGRGVQRIEEPGVTTSFDKPQGLYTTPSNVKSPHTDLGGIKTEYGIRSGAKEVVVDTSGLSLKPRGVDQMATNLVWLRQELPDVANSIRGKDMTELKTIFSKEFPNTNWSRYSEIQDMIEGYAGLKARQQGIDIIRGIDKTSPEFSEVVILNKDVVKTRSQLKAEWDKVE
jgi:hypothetical protein